MTDDFVVLHAARIRGVLKRDDELAHRAEAVGADLLQAVRVGRTDGFRLTPEGRERWSALLAEEARDDDALARAYESYKALNGEFKQLCCDWQLRDGALNDHADAAYDRACVERLSRIDDAVEPVLVSAAAACPRFNSYRLRLTASLGALDSGDLARFTSPAIDSYHTAWFELHEDFIVSLGLDRSREEA